MLFKAGPPKAIFVEVSRLKAGKPAICVKVDGRPVFRFPRVVVHGLSMVELRDDGTAWLYTLEEVEGQREEEKAERRSHLA